MIFHPQKITDVFLIEATPFADHRGVFRRHFCAKEFESHGITTSVAQANVSENHHAHTLRGFHYQLHPHGEGKTISCLKGAIYDIVVDLRPESPTYMQWLAYTLNPTNRLSVHVPPGCANAFLTMESDSLIQYYSSHSYVQSAERGIRYDDPSFKFIWPAEPAHISEKDRTHPNYQPHGA